MTFALASDELNDAELLLRLRSGDPESAARLWVRHWPAALEVARDLVDVVEVPGLAAEALIGTLASVAVGSGPQDHLASFVTAAVHELAEDELPPAPSSTTIPAVFPSRTLGELFAALPTGDQQMVWAACVVGRGAADIAADLGISTGQVEAWTEDVLERVIEAYCPQHVLAAVSPDCVDAHALLGESAADRSAPLLPTRTWMHISDCAVCTEAFHELAHSSVALGALLGTAADPGPVPVVVTHVPVPVAEDEEHLDPLHPLFDTGETSFIDLVVDEPASPEAAEPEPAQHEPAQHEPAQHEPAHYEPAQPAVALFSDEPEAALFDDEPDGSAFAPASDSIIEPAFAALATSGAPVPVEDPFDEPESPRRRHRTTRSRARVPLIAAVVLLALIGGGFLVHDLGGSDSTTPSATGSTKSPGGQYTAPAVVGSSNRTGTPSQGATTSGSNASADATTGAADPNTGTTTKPASKPSKHPTTKAPTTPSHGTPGNPTGVPSSAPPSSPPSSPTSSPTTKPCNFLQHLLGAC
ncbi:MAG TPA: hypothetical protein VHZ06_09545 [Marmoricola sp.]|nr:hypothetical protein [Marmoricola sp.]